MSHRHGRDRYLPNSLAGSHKPASPFELQSNYIITIPNYNILQYQTTRLPDRMLGWYGTKADRISKNTFWCGMMWFDMVCMMVLLLPMCSWISERIQACQRGLDEDFEVVRKLRMLHGGRQGYCSALCAIPILSYIIYLYLYLYLYIIIYRICVIHCDPMCVFQVNRPWMTMVTHTLPRGFSCED